MNEREEKALGELLQDALTVPEESQEKVMTGLPGALRKELARKTPLPESRRYVWWMALAASVLIVLSAGAFILLLQQRPGGSGNGMVAGDGDEKKQEDKPKPPAPKVEEEKALALEKKASLKKITELLDQRVTVNFTKADLGYVIETLFKLTGVNMLADPATLKDRKLTLHAENLPLRSLLDIIVRKNSGIRYTITKDAIWITAAALVPKLKAQQADRPRREAERRAQRQLTKKLLREARLHLAKGSYGSAAGLASRILKAEPDNGPARAILESVAEKLKKRQHPMPTPPREPGIRQPARQDGEF